MGNAKRRRGFTLLEVLIVLMLVSTIVSLSLFFTLGEYRRAALRAESDTVVTILQSARTAAMNNVGGSVPQGLAFFPVGYAGYVLFRGATFTASDPATREFTPLSYPVTFEVGSPAEVVFAPLAGTTTAATIVLIDPETAGSSSIAINYEGLIQ